MKDFIKTCVKFIAFILVISLFTGLFVTTDAVAAKRKKKLTDEEITQITSTLSNLTKKVYAAGLFSPQDNNNLIDIKLKLDNALEASSSNKDFPGLYYRTGVIFRAREFKDTAIECFQTVLDIYPDSPYALKSTNELKRMGVKVVTPATELDSPSAGK